MKWLMVHPEDAASKPVYLAWLKQFGVEADIIDPRAPFLAMAENYAGLLLTGGGDVEPRRYGSTARHHMTGDIDSRRDDLEIDLIGMFLEVDRPIFGICRGMQVLNVALGGKLIQHVPDALGEASAEIHSKKGTYDSRHGVQFTPGTRMADLLSDVTEVNSSHHQAVDPEHIGKGLVVAARSPAGIVEAVECFDKKPIAAVQWHPERLPPGHPAAALLNRLPGFLG